MYYVLFVLWVDVLCCICSLSRCVMLHSFFEKMCYVAFVLWIEVLCCIRSLRRCVMLHLFFVLVWCVAFVLWEDVLCCICSLFWCDVLHLFFEKMWCVAFVLWEDLKKKKLTCCWLTLCVFSSVLFSYMSSLRTCLIVAPRFMALEPCLKSSCKSAGLLLPDSLFVLFCFDA